MCAGLGDDICVTSYRYHCFGGEPVRQGWVLIALGIGGALWLQHSDAIIVGVFLVLFGAWVLTVKERVR